MKRNRVRKRRRPPPRRNGKELVIMTNVLKPKRAPKVTVSETNIRKAAARLMQRPLVSPEVQYIQRVLGATATQDAVDEKVIAVRKMPWSSIVIPERSA